MVEEIAMAGHTRAGIAYSRSGDMGGASGVCGAGCPTEFEIFRAQGAAKVNEEDTGTMSRPIVSFVNCKFMSSSSATGPPYCALLKPRPQRSWQAVPMLSRRHLAQQVAVGSTCEEE